MQLDIDHAQTETKLLQLLMHGHVNVTTTSTSAGARACTRHGVGRAAERDAACAPGGDGLEPRTRAVPIYRLVDVLFHENHVNTPIMARYWGHSMKETLADSYHLFSELRKRGILAHSWT